MNESLAKILALPTMLLLLVAVILLAAMNPRENRRCLAYTSETTWTPMPVGNQVALMPIETSTCTKWEEVNDTSISYPLGSGH